MKIEQLSLGLSFLFGIAQVNMTSAIDTIQGKMPHGPCGILTVPPALGDQLHYSHLKQDRYGFYGNQAEDI